jgi:hypothetical protein
MQNNPQMWEGASANPQRQVILVIMLVGLLIALEGRLKNNLIIDKYVIKEL